MKSIETLNKWKAIANTALPFTNEEDKTYLTSLIQFCDERIEGKVADVTWGIEDVIEQAKRDGKKISENEACNVLETAIRKHDANDGINWQVLSAHIDFAETEEIHEK